MSTAADRMSDPQVESFTKEHSEAALENLRAGLRNDCHPLSSKDCLSHADDLRGKVVLITGAGSGIGARFATLAATLGAEVVLSDRSQAAVLAVQKEIADSSIHERAHVPPKAASVTEWNELRNVFEWTDNKFGRIDVVLSSAGVTERPGFDDATYDAQGKLQPPNLSTLDINLKGSLYTTKLALHYMRKRDVKGAIVLMGSLSSFFGIPLGPMYAVSKHGILGMMRSQHFLASAYGIRINMIAPWFTDTPIIEIGARLLLAGLPLCKMSDVVNAIVYAATSPDAGGVALPVDPTGVLCLPAAGSTTGEDGFDKVFAKRAMGAISTFVSITQVAKLIGGALAPLLAVTVAGGAAAYGGYKYLK